MKLLRILTLALIASAPVFAQQGVVVQFQNQGTPIGTFAGWLPINCSTGLTCSFSGGIITMAGSGGGGVSSGTQGQPYINIDGATGNATSPLYVDASKFSTGTDMCDKINKAFTAAGSTIATVDARGFSGAQTCSAATTLATFTTAVAGDVLLLGQVTLTLKTTGSSAWTVPNKVKVYGTSRIGTVIQADNTGCTAGTSAPSACTNWLVRSGLITGVTNPSDKWFTITFGTATGAAPAKYENVQVISNTSGVGDANSGMYRICANNAGAPNPSGHGGCPTDPSSTTVTVYNTAGTTGTTAGWLYIGTPVIALNTDAVFASPTNAQETSLYNLSVNCAGVDGCIGVQNTTVQEGGRLVDVTERGSPFLDLDWHNGFGGSGVGNSGPNDDNYMLTQTAKCYYGTTNGYINYARNWTGWTSLQTNCVGNFHESGTVNTQNAATGGCSSNCVTYVSGNHITAQSTSSITINSVGYTISSVISPTVVQLTTAPGTQTGVAFDRAPLFYNGNGDSQPNACIMGGQYIADITNPHTESCNKGMAMASEEPMGTLGIHGFLGHPTIATCVDISSNWGAASAGNTLTSDIVLENIVKQNCTTVLNDHNRSYTSTDSAIGLYAWDQNGSLVNAFGTYTNAPSEFDSGLNIFQSGHLSLKGTSGAAFDIFSNTTGGTLNLGSNVSFTAAGALSIASTFSPLSDAAIDIGLSSFRWRNFLLSGSVQWLNGGVVDTGLSRDAAAVVDVGNGTAGDTSGTIQATTVKAIGTNGGVTFTEGTCANDGKAAGVDTLCGNSTTHKFNASLNNGTRFESLASTVNNAHGISGLLGCAAASASGTAYTCTTTPTFTPADGDAVLFEADVANTGSATLNVNSSSAATVKKQGGGTNLVANDLLAGQDTVLIYDGTNWQMQGLTGNAAAGGTTLTYWGTNGFSSGSQTANANLLTCAGFIAPNPVSVGHLTVNVSVADNVNLSSLEIYNSAGTLIGSVTPFTSATTASRTFAWSQGTVTVPAGKNYFCVTSVGSTFSIQAFSNNENFFPVTITTITSSGGAAPASITPPSDVLTVVTSLPALLLSP